MRLGTYFKIGGYIFLGSFVGAVFQVFNGNITLSQFGGGLLTILSIPGAISLPILPYIFIAIAQVRVAPVKRTKFQQTFVDSMNCIWVVGWLLIGSSYWIPSFNFQVGLAGVSMAVGSITALFTSKIK